MNALRPPHRPHQPRRAGDRGASPSAPTPDATRTHDAGRTDAGRTGGPLKRTSGSGDAGQAGPAGTAGSRGGATGTNPALAGAIVTGASLTGDELCAASGLSETELAGLQGFGLIEPIMVAGIPTFDEDALTVANLAAAFRKYGMRRATSARTAMPSTASWA